MSEKACRQYISRRIVVQPGLKEEKDGFKPTIDAFLEIDLWENMGGGWRRQAFKAHELAWEVMEGGKLLTCHGQKLGKWIDVAPTDVGTAIRFNGGYLKLQIEPLGGYLNDMGITVELPDKTKSAEPDLRCDLASTFLAHSVDEDSRSVFISAMHEQLDVSPDSDQIAEDLNQFYAALPRFGANVSQLPHERLMNAYYFSAPHLKGPYAGELPISDEIGPIDELIQLSGLITLYEQRGIVNQAVEGGDLEQSNFVVMTLDNEQLSSPAANATLAHFYANGRNIHFEVEVEADSKPASLITYPQGNAGGLDLGTTRAIMKNDGKMKIGWSISHDPELQSAAYEAEGFQTIIVSHDKNWYSYEMLNGERVLEATRARYPVFEMLVGVYPIQPTPAKLDKTDHYFDSGAQEIFIGYDPGDSSRTPTLPEISPFCGLIRRLVFDPTNGCESCWT